MEGASQNDAQDETRERYERLNRALQKRDYCDCSCVIILIDSNNRSYCAKCKLTVKSRQEEAIGI